MWKKLQGKKTYLTCAVMVVYAVSGLILGHLDGNASIQIILEAMAIAGVRNSI